jgi:dolichyl-phosphate beta-glucosyltransferase
LDFLKRNDSLAPRAIGQKQHNGLHVSFLIPAQRCSSVLKHTVISIRNYLQTQFPNAFEIILIPNGPRVEGDQTYTVAEELASRFLEVKVLNHQVPPGKGAALRAGFAQSLGEWVFFTDADFPYDPSFFTTAAKLLADGVDFVSGNRRLPQSHFDMPVPLLHLVYRRHCFGLIFNRIVRLLFPIKTSDTQAGIKAMSHRMAEVAFSHQTCPGFLFDLEFFLCCVGFDFQNAELPVTFFLRSEKSTIQLWREGIQAGIWLTRIFWRNQRGGYSAKGKLCPASETKELQTFSIGKVPSGPALYKR